MIDKMRKEHFAPMVCRHKGVQPYPAGTPPSTIVTYYYFIIIEYKNVLSIQYAHYSTENPINPTAKNVAPLSHQHSTAT